eukprot:gene1849-1128_t
MMMMMISFYLSVSSILLLILLENVFSMLLNVPGAIFLFWIRIEVNIFLYCFIRFPLCFPIRQTNKEVLRYLVVLPCSILFFGWIKVEATVKYSHIFFLVYGLQFPICRSYFRVSFRSEKDLGFCLQLKDKESNISRSAVVGLSMSGSGEAKRSRSVEVVLRVRPADAETASDVMATTVDATCSRRLAVQDPDGWCGAGEARAFSADMVLGAEVCNAELFRRLVLPKMLQTRRDQPDTLCFLAYGHTSSGKTHTIAGSAGAAGVPNDPGLLSLCVEELLRREGVVEVAMLEVYMENIFDLLAQGASRRVRRRIHPTTHETHVVVEDLKPCVVTSLEQWTAVAAYGMRSRRTAATDRNCRSSRSHAIFTVKSAAVRLCFVDLAGSERQTSFSAKLNAESVSINTSLSRLSTVLQALSGQRRDAETPAPYVNFRDATLTVLLQRYLTGASHTTFLACVHPAERYVKETMSTLRYTERIRRIRTAVAAENDEDAVRLYDEEANDRRLLEEIQHLRQEVGRHESDRKLLAAHQQRIAELEATLAHQEQLHRTAAATRGLQQNDAAIAALSGVPPQQETGTTRRVTRWLLGRLVRDLPPLHVRFDGYFDDLLLPTVQVVGYVTTLRRLPARSPPLTPRPCTDLTDAGSLAFLDVGDFAMGLSVLDGGIPPLVRLHRPHCAGAAWWERFECVTRTTRGAAPATKHYGFLLAFFRISDDIAVKVDHEEADAESPALGCCDALLSKEPLLPLAVVWCVPADAPLHVKESILQRLALLAQQGGYEQQQPSSSPSPTPKAQISAGAGGTFTGSSHDLSSTTFEPLAEQQQALQTEELNGSTPPSTPLPPGNREEEQSVCSRVSVSLPHVKDDAVEVVPKEDAAAGRHTNHPTCDACEAEEEEEEEPQSLLDGRHPPLQALMPKRCATAASSPASSPVDAGAPSPLPSACHEAPPVVTQSPANPVAEATTRLQERRSSGCCTSPALPAGAPRAELPPRHRDFHSLTDEEDEVVQSAQCKTCLNSSIDSITTILLFFFGCPPHILLLVDPLDMELSSQRQQKENNNNNNNKINHNTRACETLSVFSAPITSISPPVFSLLVVAAWPLQPRDSVNQHF